MRTTVFTSLLGLFFFLIGNSALLAEVPEQPQVWRIKMIGAETYAQVVLEDIMAVRAPSVLGKLKFWDRTGYEYNELELRRDVVRIRRFYHRRGFPDVSVTHRVDTGKQPWQRYVTFFITEGIPIKVVKVNVIVDADSLTQERISTSKPFKDALRRQELRPGRRFEQIRIPDVEGRFTNMLKNLGYAFASARLHAEIDSVRYESTVTLTLFPGALGTFSEIRVAGQTTATEAQIIKETGIIIGDQFSQNKLADAQRQVFNHHLYRFATVTVPEQEQDSVVVIQVMVREHPLRSLRTRAGFGNEELLRGEISWTHRNPMLTTNSFNASMRASFIQQRAGLNYLIPYVYNTRSSLQFSPFAERQDERSFLLNRAGINNAFTYQYSEYMAGTIAYEYTLNNINEKRGQFIDQEIAQLYNISALQLSGFYRPGFIVNGEGFVVNPFLEFSGILRTGSFIYQKAFLDIRRFTSLSRNTKLALRTEIGLLNAAASDSLPAFIRFYSGGTNSVRGFLRQQLGPKEASFDELGSFQGYVPVGGRALVSFNVELRQRLDFLLKGLGAATFIDGGQVWSSFSDITFSDIQLFQQYDQLNVNTLQFGVGGGISYDSPIGPIRFDLGYKLNPTQADLNIYQGRRYGGLGRWAIHFSIGQPF